MLASKFDMKHLKKAKRCIKQNVVNITIKQNVVTIKQNVVNITIKQNVVTIKQNVVNITIKVKTIVQISSMIKAMK